MQNSEASISEEMQKTFPAFYLMDLHRLNNLMKNVAN